MYWMVDFLKMFQIVGHFIFQINLKQYTFYLAYKNTIPGETMQF